MCLIPPDAAASPAPKPCIPPCHYISSKPWSGDSMYEESGTLREVVAQVKIVVKKRYMSLHCSESLCSARGDAKGKRPADSPPRSPKTPPTKTGWWSYAEAFPLKSDRATHQSVPYQPIASTSAPLRITTCDDVPEGDLAAQNMHVTVAGTISSLRQGRRTLACRFFVDDKSAKWFERIDARAGSQIKKKADGDESIFLAFADFTDGEHRTMYKFDVVDRDEAGNPRRLHFESIEELRRALPRNESVNVEVCPTFLLRRVRWKVIKIQICGSLGDFFGGGHPAEVPKIGTKGSTNLSDEKKFQMVELMSVLLAEWRVHRFQDSGTVLEVAVRLLHRFLERWKIEVSHYELAALVAAAIVTKHAGAQDLLGNMLETGLCEEAITVMAEMQKRGLIRGLDDPMWRSMSAQDAAKTLGLDRMSQPVRAMEEIAAILEKEMFTRSGLLSELVSVRSFLTDVCYEDVFHMEVLMLEVACFDLGKMMVDVMAEKGNKGAIGLDDVDGLDDVFLCALEKYCTEERAGVGSGDRNFPRE